MLKERTFAEDAPLPLILEPGDGQSLDASELASWMIENDDTLSQKLHRHGAVLFRGFGVKSPGIFRRLVKKAGSGFLDYVDGNSPRTKLTSGVYTSTEYPQQYFISLHNELSYSHAWPGRIFFCCITASETGGATVLVDSRRLLQELDPKVVEKFRAKGVKYIRNLHGGEGFGPSWQDTFETTDRDKVAGICGHNGTHLVWKEDGGLQVIHVKPAIAVHPVTKEEVWFNQADQFHPSTHPKEVYDSLISLYGDDEARLPQNVRFGDGTEISAEMLDHVRSVTRDLTVQFPWHEGDLVLVDNMLVAHGRAPFTGARRVLVSMCDTLTEESIQAA